MAKSNDIVQNALLEAKRAREVAMENAKDILIESLSPRLERVLNDKFNNLSEEEEEVGVGDRPEDANNRDEESWAGGDEAGEADGDNITEDDDEDLEEDDIEVDAEDAEAVEDVESDYAEEGVYEDDAEMDMDEDDEDMEEDDDIEELDVDMEEDDEELDLESLFYEEEDDMDEDEIEEDEEEVYESKTSKIVKERNALRKANKILTKELRESNLFNVKLSHALRLLESNGGALTGKARKRIVASLDRAKTVREAHLIARSIHESLKVAEATPRRKRIHESASRKTRVAPLLNEGKGTDRWAALAGIME